MAATAGTDIDLDSKFVIFFSIPLRSSYEGTHTAQPSRVHYDTIILTRNTLTTSQRKFLHYETLRAK